MVKLNYRTADSSRHKKYLVQATQVAMLSSEKYRHGAIVRKSGRTLALGINRRTNNPEFLENDVAKLHSSIHAEVAALKACKKSDLQGAEIYIARVNPKNKPMMSKPCGACQHALLKAGIKKVYYTIDRTMDL